MGLYSYLLGQAGSFSDGPISAKEMSGTMKQQQWWMANPFLKLLDRQSDQKKKDSNFLSDQKKTYNAMIVLLMIKLQ